MAISHRPPPYALSLLFDVSTIREINVLRIVYNINP